MQEWIRNICLFVLFCLLSTIFLLYQSEPRLISNLLFSRPAILSTSTQRPSPSIIEEYEDPVPASLFDRFVSIGNHGERTLGRAFKIEALKKAEIVNQVSGSSRSSFTNEEVVFITYASSNHFEESRAMIRGIRNVSNNTIYFYDLGLHFVEANYLKKLCNVKVIPFNFRQYPTHVQNLMTYAFKPIIMGEAYSRHRAYWIVDASARFFNKNELEKFYESIRKKELEPFLIEHKSGHGLEPYTHPEMFSFFPLKRALWQAGVAEANTMFIVRSKLSKEIIRWNMLCALTSDCISPNGSVVICQEHGGNPGCHRFDQSSVNIIHCAINLRRNQPCLNVSTWTSGAFAPFAKVARGDRYNGSLPVC